ncbi:DUF4153 domain-containing protein [Clostridium tagluense]|uniref:DUF4153 domain-containing protein n=1 Tax=Clostridium tagluense TaxID=360422 RepID=UPI001C6DDCCA|nr:DUF4173 domain-containing protein [Clostridium tagluense]MBW9156679.1 DUF4173 domain-containing protein [Clostridium tagluense]WLC64843.1 DUF4173 domain-containing protein [Clostridium tagluense]
MESKYVQAIIVKDNMVLMAYGHKENSEPINFFVRGEINEGETASVAIAREITEQINMPYKVILKFKKELSSDIETYLINIESVNDKFDISTKEIKKHVGNFYMEGLRWTDLFEKEKFHRNNINYLRLLLEECIEQDYSENWLKAVQSLVFSFPNYKYDNIRLLEKKRMKETKNIDAQIGMNEKVYSIGVALILAIIYERFFIGKQSGISIPIFYLMFMGFFLWSAREKVYVKKSIGFITIIPTVLIALNYSIHSNVILNSFNGIMILVLTLVSTVLIRYENIKWDSSNLIRKVFKRGIKSISENFYKPFIFIKGNITSRNKKEISSTKKNILKGVIISIPLLIVILVLLTSADMVFKNYITNFSIGLEDISLGKITGHLLVIIIAFIIIFSYIWSFKYAFDEGESNKKDIKWEPVTILTIIFMINLVYLLFSIVQFSYLYGGENNFTAGGFTYSEYARKGFFELVAVTIINFTILLSSMKFIKRDNKRINNISNVFLSILVAFTFNMLFSAHYKMSLYEQTYGFTYLRIFVHIFMFMLFMLFVVSLIGIWNRKISLNKILIIIVLSMYVLVNYINVDKIIASKNIDIYYKTQKIDVQYLRNLSYDAIPEILKLKEDSNMDIAKQINNYLEDLKKDLSQENSWYEFNYSKYRAKKIIDQN